MADLKSQSDIFQETGSFGGQKKIHEDLLQELASLGLREAAENLGLSMTSQGAMEVPFLGRTYLVSNTGVTRSDGKSVPEVTASGIIHYAQHKSTARPSGKFVTFSELAGPLFKQASYSASALEQPVIRRFQGRVDELIRRAESIGGRLDGEAGLGGISLIFDLLPHISVQIIFYERDEEFPARTTILFDKNATKLIDFEALAVMVTIFVRHLTR